jgi:hypothetical protein
MSYDPSLATDLDRMRFRLGDTSNDPATELLSDETYEAELTRLVDWRLAAASIATSLSNSAGMALTSFSASGDISVGWGDRRAHLLKVAADLRAEYAAEQWTTGSGDVVMTMPFLTGTDTETEWG